MWLKMKKEQRFSCSLWIKKLLWNDLIAVQIAPAELKVLLKVIPNPHAETSYIIFRRKAAYKSTNKYTATYSNLDNK